jgi:hypothetical protein
VVLFSGAILKVTEPSKQLRGADESAQECAWEGGKIA